MYCKNPGCSFALILTPETDLQAASESQTEHLQQNQDHRIGVEMIWQEQIEEEGGENG